MNYEKGLNEKRGEERRREADMLCGCSHNRQTDKKLYYSVTPATITITTNYSYMCVLILFSHAIIVACKLGKDSQVVRFLITNNIR